MPCPSRGSLTSVAISALPAEERRRAGGSPSTSIMDVIMLTRDEARRSVARDRGRPARGLGGRPADADDRAAARPAARGPGARPDQRRQGRLGARLPRAARRRRHRAPRRRCGSSSRLDEERTWCRLEPSDVAVAPHPEPAAAAERRAPTPSVAASWDAALAPLPSDWTDLLCELEIVLEHAARPDGAPLRAAQPDPRRLAARLHVPLLGPLRLRRLARRWPGAASSASTTTASPASTRVLRVLSDTDNVDTQGPVWLVGGKTL